MAGAGYKLFNTGDVLTAAQVNTYLMQQTVMVFASSAARTSALSGVLAEGMVSYLQDSNTLEVYDGSAWVGATGDITGLTAGTGITITNATGPVPTVTNDVVTTIDAKGDLIVGTGDNTYVRQAVGSNNQVLMADSAQSDGVKWANEATATLTAKGDILSASGANTLARLAVGSNGESIVADSSTSTGLRYIPYGSNNFAINGAMDFWQRGTSFSIGAFSATYTADRWSAFNANAVTISQETSIIPEGARYALKITGGATTSGYEVVQALETSDTLRLAGKTVTVSLMVAGTASKTHTITVDSSTSTDNGVWGTWSAISPAGTVVTAASNAYSQLKTTVTVPSTAKSLRIRFTTDSLTSGQVAYISLVQLEIGSTATPFRRAGVTLAGELAAAMRYYYRVDSANAGDTRMNTANMVANSTTVAYGNFSFPVRMRTSPTFGSSTATGWSLGRIAAALTALAQERSSVYSSMVKATVASGLTAGNADWLEAGNNNTAYIEFSAEL